MVPGASSQISYNDLIFIRQLSMWKILRPTKRPTAYLLLKTAPLAACYAFTSSLYDVPRAKPSVTRLGRGLETVDGRQCACCLRAKATPLVRLPSRVWTAPRVAAAFEAQAFASAFAKPLCSIDAIMCSDFSDFDESRRLQITSTEETTA